MMRIVRIVGALVLATLGPGLAGPGRAAEGENHTAVLEGNLVKSTTHGYQVTLPSKEWRFHKVETSPIKNKAADAEMSARSGGFAIIIIDPPTLSAKALSKIGTDRLQKVCPGLEETGRTEAPPGEREMLVVTAECTSENVKYWTAYLATERHCYQFVCWSYSVLFEDNVPAFQSLVDSLKEEGEPAPSPSPSGGPATEVSASPAAPEGPHTVTQEGVVVTHPIQGYTVTLPEGWTVDHPATDAHKNKDLHVTGKNDTYTIVSSMGADLTALATNKLFSSGMKNSMPDMSEGKRTETTINDLATTQVTLGGKTAEGLAMKYLLTTLCGESQCWNIASGSATPGYEVAVAEFEAFAKSFHLVAGPAPVSPATPVSVESEVKQDLEGRWVGIYGCRQGVTGLELTMKPVSATKVEAVFSFRAIPENPGVPDGSFKMQGTFDPVTRQLTLGAKDWIKRPANFVTVDLRGAVDFEAGIFSGEVTGAPDCTQFRVQKDR